MDQKKQYGVRIAPMVGVWASKENLTKLKGVDKTLDFRPAIDADNLSNYIDSLEISYESNSVQVLNRLKELLLDVRGLIEEVNTDGTS